MRYRIGSIEHGEVSGGEVEVPEGAVVLVTLVKEVGLPGGYRDLHPGSPHTEKVLTIYYMACLPELYPARQSSAGEGEQEGVDDKQVMGDSLPAKAVRRAGESSESTEVGRIKRRRIKRQRKGAGARLPENVFGEQAEAN